MRLDCGKANTELGWHPRWDLDRALKSTVDIYKAHEQRQYLRPLAEEQIRSYQVADSRQETATR